MAQLTKCSAINLCMNARIYIKKKGNFRLWLLPTIPALCFAGRPFYFCKMKCVPGWDTLNVPSFQFAQLIVAYPLPVLMAVKLMEIRIQPKANRGPGRSQSPVG